MSEHIVVDLIRGCQTDVLLAAEARMGAACSEFAANASSRRSAVVVAAVRGSGLKEGLRSAKSWGRSLDGTRSACSAGVCGSSGCVCWARAGTKDSALCFWAAAGSADRWRRRYRQVPSGGRAGSAASSGGTARTAAACLPLASGLPLLPVVDLLRALHAYKGVLFDAVLNDCPSFVRDELGASSARAGWRRWIRAGGGLAAGAVVRRTCLPA